MSKKNDRKIEKKQKKQSKHISKREDDHPPWQEDTAQILY